jgi:hypothetical protein
MATGAAATKPTATTGYKADNNPRRKQAPTAQVASASTTKAGAQGEPQNQETTYTQGLAMAKERRSCPGAAAQIVHHKQQEEAEETTWGQRAGNRQM